jgi:hypothetical protein
MKEDFISFAKSPPKVNIKKSFDFKKKKSKKSFKGEGLTL